MLLKMSERQEPQDMEGVPTPLEEVNNSNARALVFQKASIHLEGFPSLCSLHSWVRDQEDPTEMDIEHRSQSLGGLAGSHRLSVGEHAEKQHRRRYCHDIFVVACPRRSKDMVSQVRPMVLRNNNGPRTGTLGAAPSGIHVVIDVSDDSGSEDIY
ncbi:hypothetical protein U9M48_018502 [Paspalum notatum var. saurae]|uniref:Uncharacterized protein n=1 Tax=Paspalum notatum var. saurae TaxID=547442 RepID=A0AAQ3TDQ6_PASNO